jgi:hypothetical protein
VVFALEWRMPLRETAYSSKRRTYFDYGLSL